MSKKIKYLVIILIAVIIIFAVKKLGINKTIANSILGSKSTVENQENNVIKDNSNSEIVMPSKDETQNSVDDAADKKQNDNVKYIDVAASDVRIPILMYHSISDTDPENSLLVPPAQFEEQVSFLKENGYTTISLNQAAEAMKTGHVPEKPVVISFDDGYVDNYTDAFNILKKYEMTGTFFIITDNTDGGGYMSLDMLKEMKQAGMDLQNHTAHHFDLATASYDDQKESIKSGQDFLKEKVGVDSEFVCYPSGKYNDTTLQVLQELNMQGAVTTEFGTATPEDGIYTLKRIRIAPMSIEGFASIFS